MRRFVVLGVESAVGSALLNQLAVKQDVTGISLRNPNHLPDVSVGVTDVIYCGDGAVSTWDSRFGNPVNDLRHVAQYCRTAVDGSARFVYISSDVVFRGPWIFHDESSLPSRESGAGWKLHQVEKNVLRKRTSLVIRTNTLSDSAGTFVSELRTGLENGKPRLFRSDLYATPLAVERFAQMVERVLQSDATGILHLAGAERLTPWSFAVRLAASQSHDRTLLVPQAFTQSIECSLRCSRALQEFGLRMPTVTQTLDDLRKSSTLLEFQAA